MKNITLRQAKKEDLLFLFEVSTRAMKPVTEALNHPGKTIAEYTENFDPEKIQVIQYEGRDVGRLRVLRSPESIYIGGIQILPEFQSKGIGTVLMKDLIEESKESDVPIALEVHKINRKAQDFYTQLGFRLEASIGEKSTFKYSPAQ